MKSDAALAVFRHRLDRVIDHIDRHPDSDLSLDALARVANFSPFHFHRVFKAYTGRSVLSYVTRSRLNRAVFVMRTSPQKRLHQVAADCGFESIATFSKAFKKAYGAAPSRIDLQSLLRSQASSLVDASLHSPAEAPPKKRRWRVRIETRPAMQLASVRVQGGYLRPQSLVDGYLRLQAWIDRTKLDRSRSLLIGMSMDDPDIVPLAECRYDFSCTVPADARIHSPVRHSAIPAAEWAVLHCKGSLADVDQAWTYLFRDWLPRSGWQAAALPAMEVFHQRPEIIGWDRFDLDCCLPVTPLATG